MCLRASDPAGHHGLDIMDGVDGGGAVGGGPGFVGSPHIWPDRRRSRFRGSSFHRRCCLPAYRREWASTSVGMPSAASRMGVEALPEAFPWKGGTGIVENPVKSPI